MSTGEQRIGGHPRHRSLRRVSPSGCVCIQADQSLLRQRCRGARGKSCVFFPWIQLRLPDGRRVRSIRVLFISSGLRPIDVIFDWRSCDLSTIDCSPALSKVRLKIISRYGRNSAGNAAVHSETQAGEGASVVQCTVRIDERTLRSSSLSGNRSIALLIPAGRFDVPKAIYCRYRESLCNLY